MKFDYAWARDPVTRFRFGFTRLYGVAGVGIRGKSVLLDVFTNASNTTKAEVAKRRESILKENAARATRNEPLIGYMPIVRGVILAEEAFSRVLAGEVLPLLERKTQGVLV